MDLNFTRLITYNKQKKCTPDIYADAFGIDALEAMLFGNIGDQTCSPDDDIVADLFSKIRNDAKVH